MIERFFDLEIATVAPDEEAPRSAHVVRVLDPDPELVAARAAAGWFYKPLWVTYMIDVPQSLDEYVGRAFPSRARNKPRKLLREVPRRYAFAVEPAAGCIDAFRALYARTVVAKPRGRDRVAEHEGGFGRGWLAFTLRDGGAMAGAVLVHAAGRHLSVAYGAFDPEHRRRHDLEHFLLMQVLARSIELGHRTMSLGIDTNRYGHHLSIGLPAYKLRIGFTPQPYEPGGRELARYQRFDVFEEGLFFYAYETGGPAPSEAAGRVEGFVGHYFARGEPDLRPFRHDTAPPIRVHPIPP